MAYQAEISRKNPGCFLFLVDQSESMEDPFGGGEAGRRKAEELATILNKLIHNLCIRCSKSDSIYDYFHVGVLGYSEDSCKPALGGELSGRSLVPISELANKPLRIEDRVKQSDDGAGGVMDQTVKFPVWFDPYSKGGTPMCAALKEATQITQTWCQEHPNGFPPIVINITDGEATDGDLVAEARKLAAVSGEDGSVLLFNIHLSSTAGPSIELPGNGKKLPDQHAKQLFEASSTLTPFMVARATESSFAKLWAVLLAESYGPSELAGAEFFARLQPARRLWRRRLAGRPLPWFASEKAEQGAFAAFLGVEIDAHKNRWTALAVGDCCLMQVDDVGKGMRAVETFPLQRSSQFTMSPYLIGSRSDGESLNERIQISKGSLRDGDMLLLATDAMAAWLLKRQEEGRPLWKWLYRKLGTPESFVAMVAYGRKNGLRNDDFTLVRVIHHDSRVEAKES